MDIREAACIPTEQAFLVVFLAILHDSFGIGFGTSYHVHCQLSKAGQLGDFSTRFPNSPMMAEKAAPVISVRAWRGTKGGRTPGLAVHEAEFSETLCARAPMLQRAKRCNVLNGLQRYGR